MFQPVLKSDMDNTLVFFNTYFLPCILYLLVKYISYYEMKMFLQTEYFSQTIGLYYFRLAGF